MTRASSCRRLCRQRCAPRCWATSNTTALGTWALKPDLAPAACPPALVHGRVDRRHQLVGGERLAGGLLDGLCILAPQHATVGALRAPVLARLAAFLIDDHPLGSPRVAPVAHWPQVIRCECRCGRRTRPRRGPARWRARRHTSTRARCDASWRARAVARAPPG